MAILRILGPASRGPSHWGRWVRFAAATLAAIVLLAACSNGDDQDSSAVEGFATSESFGDEVLDTDMSDDAVAAAMAERGDNLVAASIMASEAMDEEASFSDDDGQASGADGSDALAADVPTAATGIGREIIYTARVSVESADVAASAAEATSVIEGLGGFTFAQDIRTEGRARSVLTFKISPERFFTALDHLSSVGELVEQSVSADDVTGIVVDLNSRISTAEVSVNRLREFLSQATEVEGVAELERELSDRETNLERLRGQLRSLRDQVDLSTITLSITQSVEAVPPTSVILKAWAAASDQDPCLGFTDLVAPPDDEIGFCFELENDGETALTEVTLSSNELRFRSGDLTVPDGMNLERIEPGERVTATLVEPITDGRIAGRVATRGLEIDVRLSAVPVTETGSELARLARSASLFLVVEEEDTSPGFGDALSGGWGVLVAIGKGVLLVIGALLPFLPIIAIVLVAAWWWLWHRRAKRPVASSSSETTRT